MKYPVRKCSYCNEPTLRPVGRRFFGFSNVVQYECATCQTVLDVKSAANVGISVTVGAMALLIWGFILSKDIGGPSLMAILLLCFAALGLCWVIIPPAIVLFKNPPVGSGEHEAIQSDSIENTILPRILGLVENAGFLGGLLAPLLVIGVVLAIATLIGFINFTYFGN